MNLLRDASSAKTNLLALIVTLTTFACSNAWGAAPQWLPQQTNDIQLSVSGATITIHTTGVDPFLVWRTAKPFAANNRVLEFEYFCTEELDSVYGFLGPPISESTRFDLPDLAIAQGWQRYAVDLVGVMGKPIPANASQLRIDFGMSSGVRLQIRGIQLRARTPNEIAEELAASIRRQQKLAQSREISRYLRSTFPARFDDVTVDDQFVTLAGTMDREIKRSTSLQLVEYPPSEPINSSGIPCGDTLEITENHFRVRVARRLSGRDRLHSGWRIRETDADDASFLTARHYATAIVPKGSDYSAEQPRPKSQKGLSGISRRGPLDDLLQLGIRAVTLNLVLNHFVTTKAGAGAVRIDVPGEPVYFNSHAFRGYDELVDFARRHEIVITAIVLIPRSKRDESRSPLVHPEANGGVYAMPDLSTERGTGIYGFVLDKIAERYRNTDRESGGITNWIAHNEVDVHPVWTNMGAQPREVFTETYYRSMRMIHNAARMHNPHARVFASLTHHWVLPDDGKWRRLAPKEVLQTLQRYSEQEGDFAWGVAYHPYPQDLFASVAWNDTNVRDDAQTPLITIQNLHVLGEFLQQAGMRDESGELRPVLLSEQGFHTDSYGKEAQDRQAGSLWYAMRKVRTMPWIESFHYHRWIDHPDEGGLMLGLRTLPTAQHRYGEPKRSWHVYQAIGTENEEEATIDLPAP